MRVAGAVCFALLGGLLVAACNQAAPAGPTSAATTTLTGTWIGDVAESYGGRGRLRLVVQQTQFALSGTFTLDFEDSRRSRAGALSGNVATSSLLPRMQLSASEGFVCAAGQSPDSFMQVTWTQSGDDLAGEYVGFGCAGPVTGAFLVKRQ